ncbi:iron chaperone [Terrabacter sp. Ter38]|uniref:iron chaperone n=1 Tax=Terrabacter sp. Ter38 TaxID=2926030 RepID=UPI0021177FB6|nr:DUF1801 domain-containing protein [Terrabacter sp. Ter38]
MSEPETTPDATATSAPMTVDAYVQGFPDGPRQVLEQVAAALRRAVPGGEEKIRYGMPAIMFSDRYGIHFAGWKKHVGLYPVGELEPDLEAEVASHRAKKDTVQFFYQDPVPYDLIERVARALAARHRA